MQKSIANFIVKTFNDDREVRENPTCYIYDLQEIKDRVKEITDNKKANISLYYAMKANPNKEVLRFVMSLPGVKGIEIASIGELEIAEEVGLKDHSKVLFTGPGKTYKELESAIERNIRFINVESLVEAIRINEIAAKKGIDKVPILLRVNIDYFIDGAEEHMAGFSTKLGVDQCNLFDTYEKITKLGHIEVKGLHVFSADGVLDHKVLLKYANYVFNMVREFERKYDDIEVIDFGGGFGIDYTKRNQHFDTKSYFEVLEDLIKGYSFEDKEIILELGKFIVGSCGYYATKIIDIKDCKGKKHIVTAGGVNHMRLPIATDRKHPVYIINLNEEKLYSDQPTVKNEVVDIEGPLCMTEDKISWDEEIDEANIGDIVVLTQAGAYCYSASTLWFLSHPLPKEIIKY